MSPELPATPDRTITVADLDALVIEYFDIIQKTKVEAEKVVTAININIASIERRLVAYLKVLERKEYKHPRGTVRISPKWSVNMPQTDADKKALFDWLRSKGIYDKYATVNSSSLNSLWNAEREAAIKEDPTAALTWNLPGLGTPKLFEALGKNKGKGEEE